MKLSLPDLKMVTLECPYDNWDNQELTSLFTKMVSLKLRGYRKEYPYGVLPVDTTDFLATHHLVCKRDDTGFAPVMGFKTITYSRCKTHRISFPLLSILSTPDLTVHARIVASTLETCDLTGEDAAYASSWTIDPEIRRDRETVSYLRAVLVTMLLRYYQETGTKEKFICGSLRFKTDKMLDGLGYKYLRNADDVLPSFQQAALIGDSAVAMHCQEFRAQALADAEKYRFFWENRKIIGSSHAQPKEERQAA